MFLMESWILLNTKKEGILTYVMYLWLIDWYLAWMNCRWCPSNWVLESELWNKVKLLKPFIWCIGCLHNMVNLCMVDLPFNRFAQIYGYFNLWLTLRGWDRCVSIQEGLIINPSCNAGKKRFLLWVVSLIRGIVGLIQFND
mgnify:CR=1 FL=1